MHDPRELLNLYPLTEIMTAVLIAYMRVAQVLFTLIPKTAILIAGILHTYSQDSLGHH